MMKDLILRNEPYIAHYKPRKIMKKRLVLRDEYGKIRLVTKDPCQERRIITLGARIKLDPETCQSIMRRGFKSTANAVTVSAFGNDLIEGSASKSLTSQYDKAILLANGVSEWLDLGTSTV